MKKLIYTLLLLLVTFPAMAQSLFEQYERFLTEPRTYGGFYQFHFLFLA